MPRHKPVSDEVLLSTPLGAVCDHEIVAMLAKRGIRISSSTVGVRRARLGIARPRGGARRRVHRVDTSGLSSDEARNVRLAVQAVAREYRIPEETVESVLCGAQRSLSADNPDTIGEARSVAYLLIYQLISVDDRDAALLLQRLPGRWSLERLASRAARSNWLRARANAIALRFDLPTGYICRPDADPDDPDTDLLFSRS